MAIFMSLIIKNPGDDEDEEEIDEETTKLASDEIPLHPMNSESEALLGTARKTLLPLDTLIVQHVL